MNKDSKTKKSALNTADKALFVLMALSLFTLSTCGIAASWFTA
jgi:hypothetical protein